MQGNMQDNTSALSRSLDELRADKKKAGLLIGLLAVGAYLAFRSLSGESLPRPAAATAVNTVAPAAVSPDASALLAEVRKQENQRREEYLNSVDRTMSRDVFAMNVSSYPLAEPAGPLAAVVEVTAPQGPSQSEIAEAQRLARQARQEAVRLQAATLTLQGTMLTAVPTAIINNNIVKVGDEVGGFVVKRIGQGECVIELEDVQVSLRME